MILQHKEDDYWQDDSYLCELAWKERNSVPQRAVRRATRIRIHVSSEETWGHGG